MQDILHEEVIRKIEPNMPKLMRKPTTLEAAKPGP